MSRRSQHLHQACNRFCPEPQPEGDWPEADEIPTTLEGFIQLYEQLKGVDPLAAARFALTGYAPEDRARVSITKHALSLPQQLERGTVQRQYDIDSVRGFWLQNDQWWFRKAFEIYPVPRRTDTIIGTSRLKIWHRNTMVCVLCTTFYLHSCIWAGQRSPICQFWICDCRPVPNAAVVPSHGACRHPGG